jgi:GntR family transcriptional regulator
MMTKNFTGINPDISTPLYAQLEERLIERLKTEWKPGEQIPTESELCTQYGVSRITMRHAIARLVNRGLLERGRGRGTFVRDNRLTADVRSVSSYTDEITELGMKPGSKLLSATPALADIDVAEIFDIPEGTELLVITRLRTGDGKPIGLQQTTLIAEMVPNISQYLRDDSSLYAILRDKYAITPTEAVETYTVNQVPSTYTSLLEVSKSSPVFIVDRVSRNSSSVFEHTHSIMRGDRYRIRLGLRN